MVETTPVAVSNLPEFSVSEISGAVKRTLEGAFARVRVRGEITEMKRYPSGHIYFSLKDEGAKLSGVVWKFTVPKLALIPENGVEVIATGRISSYADRSSYQLIVEQIEYAGAGALLARIEALRLRLAAEGLFDTARKQAIPLLPMVIGVVTSAQGAVIQDIRTTLARRFPRRLLLWPVPVQGEAAAARIAAAIAGFDALVPDGEIPRPDVLIIARGGGSLEDLMAFNDEAVLRAAAACRIPLISAVGHETDTTLIDHVADRRAPTPTAAAEMAVPARLDLLAELGHQAARLSGSVGSVMQHGRLRLNSAVHGLPDLPSLLGQARQRVDDRTGRLHRALPALLAGRRAGLVAAERRLPDPPALIAAARQNLASATIRLHAGLPALVATRRGALALGQARLAGGIRHALASRAARAAPVLARPLAPPVQAIMGVQAARLEGLAARLLAGSPDAVLARGYARITDMAGHPVTQAASVLPGRRLVVSFADGRITATADRRGPAGQGVLI